MIALLAALDLDFAIGSHGALPWHLPDDLKRFKRLTLGKCVLMGSKTALSIGRALPGRDNLVMSRGGAAAYPGQVVVDSIDAAIDHAAGDDLIVIGGGEIYALAIARAERMYLTWVYTHSAQADTHFPRYDDSAWTIVAEEAHPADARHAFPFRFVDYARRAAT